MTRKTSVVALLIFVGLAVLPAADLIDRAGLFADADVARLQGRWRSVGADGLPPTETEHLLIIEGRIATFTADFADRRTAGKGLAVDRLRFTLYTGGDKKIIRFTDRLEGSEPLGISTDPRAVIWYTLNGDRLVLWDRWAEIGEGGPRIYQRIDS